MYNFQYKKENHRKLSQTCSYGIFSKRLKNEFETAVVNEPLKFYCSSEDLKTQKMYPGGSLFFKTLRLVTKCMFISGFRR